MHYRRQSVKPFHLAVLMMLSLSAGLAAGWEPAIAQSPDAPPAQVDATGGPDTRHAELNALAVDADMGRDTTPAPAPKADTAPGAGGDGQTEDNPRLEVGVRHHMEAIYDLEHLLRDTGPETEIIRPLNLDLSDLSGPAATDRDIDPDTIESVERAGTSTVRADERAHP